MTERLLHWWRGGRFVFFLLCLGIAGCDSLPADLEKQALAIPARMKGLEEALKTDRVAFAKSKESPDWSFFNPYAEKEEWEKSFQTAEAELRRAGKLFVSTVEPILKADTSADGEKLKVELKRIDDLLKGVAETSRSTAARMGFLKLAKEHADTWINDGRKNHRTIVSLHVALDPFVKRAERDYPNRSDVIASMYAPLLVLKDDATKYLVAAESEFARHRAGELADYALFGDGIQLVEDNSKKFQKLDNELRTTLGELYTSYTKILSDMKVEYWVQIGRTSWDESSDWPTEHQYLYPPVQVSQSDFEYIARDVAEKQIATYGCFFGCRTNVAISNDVWKTLTIGGREKEQWPSRSDDHAEFWIAETEPRYFHKYTLVHNGVRKETEWTQVDDEDFEDLESALGMEIESKPYGAFAAEQLSHPAPAGMSYVGNPKYGKWEQDAQGRERWSWLETYAFYHLMFGGTDRHHYYRDDWNTWNRDYRGKDAYYGAHRGSTEPQYGTHSRRVATSPTYAGTDFSKSGGLKSAQPNVRAAGVSSRSRGPGTGK